MYDFNQVVKESANTVGFFYGGDWSLEFDKDGMFEADHLHLTTDGKLLANYKMSEVASKFQVFFFPKLG